MEQAPTGRLPVPRTRSLNSLSTATSDAEAKRSAIRSRSPSMRGMAPPPPPGAARTSASRLSPNIPARSVSPAPRVSATTTTTRNPSVMSTTGARAITRTGAPPPPPVRSSMIRAPSPASRRASMPDVGEEGAPEGRSSGDEPKRPGHTRTSSTASDASSGLPKSISRLTQPQAPSFMSRTKSVPDKRPSATSRAPPPAPVRKGTPAAAAKAQELQARLDALKKTAEQLRAKSTKPPVGGGNTGIKRPGERSAPSSPKGVTRTDVTKRSEEGEVSVLKLDENVEELLSTKEEREKQEEEEAEKRRDKARKEQEELVREQQARKDSMLVRAAAALERKLAEEKRVEKEKLEKKQREDEEEEIRRKLDEERRQREKEREEEEEARKKRELIEQEEIERKRALEEREEQQREEERREIERQREMEARERERITREKEKEEEEKRKLEQERLLQETEEAEREVIRKRLEKEEEERKKVKEEEERKRQVAEEERRKQKEQEELERKKQEEERRKQREKEEEERKLQKAKEEEERRKQIEREEEERRQRIERETEARRKQQEIEDERRRQELEEERRKQKELDEKREEERRKQKEREEEERRKQKAKEEEEEIARKKQQEIEEKKKKRDLEEKQARDSQFLKVGRNNNKDENEEEEDEDEGRRRSSSNLSNITKAKIGGPARKARSGLKFDARASTDVVRAPSVSELSMRMELANETKDEPRDSDLRPERKPFMGAGMNGLAGLAQQAAGGLAALKPLKSSGDRAAPRSPASRKGPFEVTFKSDGKGDKTAVAVLDALDSVAKGHAWVILAFDNEVFALTSTGEGVGQAALDAMKEHLTSTSINFLYFNAGSGDKDEGAAKCSEIMWQGEKTKLLVKARAGAVRETLHLFTKRCFTIGVQKEASTHDDLDVSRIFGGNGGEVSPAPSNPSPADNKPSPLLATPRRNSDVPSPLVSRNSVSARSSAMEVPPLLSRVSTVSRSSANEGKSSPGSSNPLRPDIQWTGQEEIAKAVKDFLAAEGPSAFIVLDIEGPKKNEVKVAATGFGALTEEWREKHCGAAKCSVFIIKAENKESGYVSLEKIVYIQWVGRQVKILEKGRAKEIYSGLKEFVREQTGTLAGEMEVLEGEAKDVNLQAVTESITGSRQRGSAMQGTLTKKVERSAGGPVDLSYADEEELRSIIAQLSQEKLTWVALTYSANKPATLEILGSGVGENTSISWGKEPTKAQEEEQNKRDRQADTPTAQYKKFCKQSNIVFIVHRFLRIPEQFQFSKDMGTYAKSHFGLMMWQGEDCRVMDKAASSHHWKDFCNLVRDIMEKAGVYVEAGVYVATKMDELNPRDIRKGMRMDMY